MASERLDRDHKAAGSAGHDPFSASGSGSNAGRAQFRTTQWSLVVAAGDHPGHSERDSGSDPTVAGDRRAANQALEELCGRYWFPIYSFLRRRGSQPEEAADLTQGFFALLLERGDFGRAERERGRFRSYLLQALTHFVANERKAGAALKRGGAQRIFSLDQTAGADDWAAQAEARWSHEVAASGESGWELADKGPSPEDVYQQVWARELLDRVTAKLHNDFDAAGKLPLLQALQPLLGLTSGPGKVPRLASLGAELGMSEGAVKVALHRLRQRTAELLRAEIASTVADPEAVEDEVRGLFEVFRSPQAS